MRKLQLDEKKLRELHALDVQLWKIADIFGCNRATIDRRLRALGLRKARTGPKSAERHPDWNGGTTIRKGYRYVWQPNHPNCINGRYVAEHRLAMEKKLGRLLDRKEVVHHKDGNRLNNDLSNLALYLSNGEHLYEHLAGNPEHGKRIAEGLKKAAQERDILQKSK